MSSFSSALGSGGAGSSTGTSSGFLWNRLMALMTQKMANATYSKMIQPGGYMDELRKNLCMLAPLINSTTVGGDLGVDDKRFYPLSRTYSLGLSVNF